MSYAVDLDEVSDDALFAEYDRRLTLRMDGRCTYCGRPLDQPPCRFPDRHRQPGRRVAQLLCLPPAAEKLMREVEAGMTTITRTGEKK